MIATLQKLPQKITMDNTTYKTVHITCSYIRLNIAKTGLPLFIHFKSNNTILIKLEGTFTEEKIKLVLKSVDKWFDGLKVLNIEKY